MKKEIMHVEPTSELPDLSEENIKNASALLALMHGKSDSICRVYDKEVLVTLEQLGILEKMVEEKLGLHSVLATTTTIDITLSNRGTYSFKTWKDFHDFSWDHISEAVKSIYMQWDFLLMLPNYKVPQRHTLSVKISSRPNPGEILTAMLHGDLEEDDGFSANTAALITKVDFINHVLAEELSQTVGKWYELCEKAVSRVGKARLFIYKHDEIITRTIELLSATLLSFIVLLFLKLYLFEKITLTTNYIIYIGVLVFPLILVFTHIINTVKYNAKRKINHMVNTHAFEITNGDLKKVTTLKEKAKVSKEIGLLVLNLVLDIVLGYIFFAL